MPSNVVLLVGQGFNWAVLGSATSSWSERGKPLPYLPYAGKLSFGLNASTMLKMYNNSLRFLPQHPAAIIPIERSHAKLLLVCGELDTLWPSCQMARQLKLRSEKLNGPSVAVLAYPHAGHGVMGAPRPNGDNLAGFGDFGGSAGDNQAARIDGWPKVEAFLRAALVGDPSIEKHSPAETNRRAD